MRISDWSSDVCSSDLRATRSSSGSSSRVPGWDPGAPSQPLILTVETAMTVPTGKSWGSLQVSATSPSRAAGRPLIFTVADPTVTLARFCGGFTKLPPIGTWDGELVAVEPLVAAAIPSILTSELSSPSSVPVKGWGTTTGEVGPGG